MDPLALTSRWMAAARAREGERPHRLFLDPLAAELAGPEGFAWLEHTEPVARLGGQAGPPVGPGLYVVVRTRFFDDFLLRACRDGGVRQVVLLASGMDARAFRLPWPPGTRLYELDRPGVHAAKEDVLARLGARANCDRCAIGADLEGASWPRALLDAGYEAREPSAWLAEGLFFYLTKPAVHALLDAVGALATTGSYLGADLVGGDLLLSPVMRPLLEALARRGVSGRFGTDDPEGLFAGPGWETEVFQPGGLGANYGRWPYPVMPRGIRGVPRLFLVRASRVRSG